MNLPVKTIYYGDLPPIDLPREVEIDLDKADDGSIVKSTRNKWVVTRALVDAWKNDIEANTDILRLFKKYCVNDGWSNGFTIKFWEMTPSELKLVWRWFNDGKDTEKNNTAP